ncbi:MAG: TatD family hydrolase [Holophaga sp.]|nr:TatD family hydrolase [Holophaga sp.]
MSVTYFDSHCHLQNPRFAGRIPEVVARAQAAGVTHMVCCATREADWDQVLDLAREHACILPMLGLHPWFAGEAAAGWATRLRARVEASGAGIGECGLDFTQGRPGRAGQEAAFQTQLRLALDLDLPLSIHCVRAWGRLVALLRATGVPAAGGLVHAFSGSRETAAELQGLGLHLSFGYARGEPPALTSVAGSRLLFETDAPGGAGENREPAHVVQVAAGWARVRGAGPELAVQVQQNARQLFRRWLP